MGVIGDARKRSKLKRDFTQTLSVIGDGGDPSYRQKALGYIGKLDGMSVKSGAQAMARYKTACEEGDVSRVEGYIGKIHKGSYSAKAVDQLREQIDLIPDAKERQRLTGLIAGASKAAKGKITNVYDTTDYGGMRSDLERDQEDLDLAAMIESEMTGSSYKGEPSEDGTPMDLEMSKRVATDCCTEISRDNKLPGRAYRAVQNLPKDVRKKYVKMFNDALLDRVEQATTELFSGRSDSLDEYAQSRQMKTENILRYLVERMAYLPKKKRDELIPYIRAGVEKVSMREFDAYMKHIASGVGSDLEKVLVEKSKTLTEKYIAKDDKFLSELELSLVTSSDPTCRSLAGKVEDIKSGKGSAEDLVALRAKFENSTDSEVKKYSTLVVKAIKDGYIGSKKESNLDEQVRKKTADIMTDIMKKGGERKQIGKAGAPLLGS